MSPIVRRSLIALLALGCSASLLAGCGKSSSAPGSGATPGSGAIPPPVTPPATPPTTPPPVTPPPDIVVDASPPPDAPSPAPPANVGQGLRIATPEGLYLLAPPLAGEPSFEGPVQVELAGAIPPPDATVELNGVPLVRTLTSAQGAADKFWAVDPAAPLPPRRGDDAVVLTARSGSQVHSLTLPCPADLAVTVSAAPGASLSGSTTLRIAWAGDLAVNRTNSLVTDFFASGHLRGLEIATGALEPGRLSQALVPHGATAVVLDVPPTAASGYAAELRWQGAFVQELAGSGFCGRVKRLVYER